MTKGASAATIARSGSGSAMRFPKRAFTNARNSFGQMSLRASILEGPLVGACAACVSAKSLSLSPSTVHVTTASSGSHVWEHESHTRSYSATSPYDIRREHAARLMGPGPARRPHVAHDGHRRDARGDVPPQPRRAPDDRAPPPPRGSPVRRPARSPERPRIRYGRPYRYAALGRIPPRGRGEVAAHRRLR